MPLIQAQSLVVIYIPVWIDQKPSKKDNTENQNNEFTFQYGQIRNACPFAVSAHNSVIYIPVWIDQKPISKDDFRSPALKFTFQYGQIRNLLKILHYCLLFLNLHSSMDRLETRFCLSSSYYGFTIYIPVWIDQKRIASLSLMLSHSYLHSSMDRLETFLIFFLPLNILIFTFQYGQIRNSHCLYIYYTL